VICGEKAAPHFLWRWPVHFPGAAFASVSSITLQRLSHRVNELPEFDIGLRPDRHAVIELAAMMWRVRRKDERPPPSPFG